MNKNRPYYRKNRHIKLKIGLILILIGILAFVLSLDKAIRPILLQHAQAKAQIYANNIINRVVQAVMEEQKTTYNDLVHITRDTAGIVRSIEIDSVYVNLVKAQIIGKTQNQISENNAISVEIPAGTLTGSDYLIGRGPKLVFNMDISAAVTSGLKSSFTSAGINQTLHRITLHITSKLYLVMPLYRTGCEISNDFLIAETVLVGEIPDAFTNVVETPSDDIAGVLFDYSAEVS